MTRTADRISAWAASVAAHGVGVLALFLALGHGHMRAPEDRPTRLVYVEPVSPPLARPAAPAGAPATEAVPVPPVAPAEPPAESAPPSRTSLATKPPQVIRKALVPPRVASPPAAPAAARAPTDAPTDARPDGREGGTASGAVGGAVGGLGDTPLSLRNVAAPPELVTRVVPEYPARARAMQIEGQVMLEVVLDREGRPEPDVKVVHSIALLDDAAVAAVRLWRFRPARDAGGRAVRVIMQVPVRFVLR